MNLFGIPFQIFYYSKICYMLCTVYFVRNVSKTIFLKTLILLGEMHVGSVKLYGLTKLH